MVRASGLASSSLYFKRSLKDSSWTLKASPGLFTLPAQGGQELACSTQFQEGGPVGRTRPLESTHSHPPCIVAKSLPSSFCYLNYVLDARVRVKGGTTVTFACPWEMGATQGM